MIPQRIIRLQIVLFCKNSKIRRTIWRKNFERSKFFSYDLKAFSTNWNNSLDNLNDDSGLSITPTSTVDCFGLTRGFKVFMCQQLLIQNFLLMKEEIGFFPFCLIVGFVLTSERSSAASRIPMQPHSLTLSFTPPFSTSAP